MSAQTPNDHVADLLPAFVNRTLDATAVESVKLHLASCAGCRNDLAGWQGLARVMQDASARSEAPSPAVMSRVWMVIDETRPDQHARWARPTVAHVWQVLLGQLLLVQRRLWLASAVVLGVGFLVAETGQLGSPGLLLQLVAPIVAALGVSMVYGPETDPAIELALATPTSPRLVLLARLTLVFGYDLLLTLMAAIGLGMDGHGEIWSLNLDWLGPMLFLSGLALLLSIRIGPTVAMSVSLVIWMVRLMLAIGGTAVLLDSDVVSVATRAWSTNVFTLLGAALCLAAALSSTRFREQPG